jgi:hypothetical protein
VLNFTVGHNPIDALTSTSPRELREAITGPIPGQGWYDDANGEIGDICAWKSKKLGKTSGLAGDNRHVYLVANTWNDVITS